MDSDVFKAVLQIVFCSFIGALLCKSVNQKRIGLGYSDKSQHPEAPAICWFELVRRCIAKLRVYLLISKTAGLAGLGYSTILVINNVGYEWHHLEVGLIFIMLPAARWRISTRVLYRKSISPPEI